MRNRASKSMCFSRPNLSGDAQEWIGDMMILPIA